MFFLDSGDPNFHDFQLNTAMKDGRQLVTVKLPYLYGVKTGELPDDFHGFSHTCGEITTCML